MKQKQCILHREDQMIGNMDMIRLLNFEKELVVGRRMPCNIILSDIQEISSMHLRIVKEIDVVKLYMMGKNGGYINGRFVGKGECHILEYADEISLSEIRLLWLYDAIAIHLEDNIRYELNSIYEYENNKTEGINNIVNNIDTQEDRQIYDLYFSKAPRTFYSINDEIIELDPPPEKHIEEKQPLYMTIGPAFTMALPMTLGVIVSKMATKSIGGSETFMYTGLITALSSAAFGVIWGLTNIKNRRTQLLQNEQKRKLIYSEYVRESELQIKELYNKNVSNLRLQYPNAEEYVKDGINQFLLWNRCITDEDFLKIRLGTGDIPYSINVQIPRNRFSIVDDELKNLPKRLKTNIRF